jgi:hypothetical protein
VFATWLLPRRHKDYTKFFNKSFSTFRDNKNSFMAQLKPGAVTGKDYLTLVAAAKAGGYALPAVNVSSSSTTDAVLEAAARNQAGRPA